MKNLKSAELGRKWGKKLCVLLLAIVLMFGATSCETTAKTEDGKEIPVPVGELEFFTDTVGAEVVFWYKNNSQYSIGSTLILVKIDKKTNEEIIFRVNDDVKAGATSERGTVRRQTADDLIEVKDTSEISDLDESYVSYGYLDESSVSSEVTSGEYYYPKYTSVRYDYKTKTYRNY